jgi:hypothetical protein
MANLTVSTGYQPADLPENRETKNQQQAVRIHGL